MKSRSPAEAPLTGMRFDRLVSCQRENQQIKGVRTLSTKSNLRTTLGALFLLGLIVSLAGLGLLALLG